MEAEPTSLDDFDITRYPDYRQAMPPDVYRLQQFSHLDEYENVWGRAWGLRASASFAKLD